MATSDNQPVNCVADYGLYPDTQKEHTCHVCLNTSAVVGLAFQVEAALVSLVALLGLVLLIAPNYRRNLRNPPNRPWRLFRCNMDILMLNLVVADIWMSVGGLPSIYWAHKRQVHCGSYCDAQGAIQTIGETAVAFATLLVTVYTFFVIYSGRRHAYRPWRCLGVVVSTWAWVILWGVVPLGMFDGQKSDKSGVKRYYTPTPWWCWINGRYMVLRIFAEYLWLWIAGVGTILLYVPSYLIIRRAPEPEEGCKNPEKMLYYPLAYTFAILPLSIMRWAAFRNPELLENRHMNAPSMIFGTTFYLLGLTNSLLAIYTRPAVLLIGSDGHLDANDPRVEYAEFDDLHLPRFPEGVSSRG